ncbi:hypothetical protein B0H16DRAFT_18455 [Mycena metata]|uniref:LYR motif-containing protein Cup1-like N-terminal domain-containing protein n=1 Tax=Mycena metata TaxID=1033252 RepID=A0AAD7KHX8_9AGAR|nr:hypothetical protein B0H16DRAFT_18455 [Mycena metata]
MSSQHQVFTLYKAFVRQTRKLPQLYLRQFWRIKGFDDVRAILKTDASLQTRDQKIKRMAKDLRKLEGANRRNMQAFNHVLGVAYGRKGKLKRELMEPILIDPSAPVPAKIIPAVESSRPPVYSDELQALLTSSESRMSKVLPKRQLESPPKLPPRANPQSEEARLLGPFSKRRETNTRWRFFTEEWQKVKPPLEVVVDAESYGSTLDNVRSVGIRSLPLQGLSVFSDVEALARTRQENVRSKDPHMPSKPHPPRWLRRRYRTLLDNLPILTYKKSEGQTPRYSVSLSPSRISSRETNAAIADSSDLKWLE